MNVKQRYTYFLGMLVYKSLHGLAPVYLSSKLKYVESRHDRTTRAVTHGNLVVPRATSEMLKKSFSYAAPVTWNSISPIIRSAASLPQFKSQYNAICRNYNV